MIQDAEEKGLIRPGEVSSKPSCFCNFFGICVILFLFCGARLLRFSSFTAEEWMN